MNRRPIDLDHLDDDGYDDPTDRGVSRDLPTQRVGRTPHTCDDGWIDRDADQPKPCTVCKPHLAPGNLDHHNRTWRYAGDE